MAMDKRLEGTLQTLEIDGYASDGAGVSRLDGMAVFVSGALRGERCQVRLDKVGRRAVWGHVVQVLRPSPERVVPRCPYDGRCGGCALGHMSYAEELSLKRDRVDQALRRIGGLDLTVSAIHGAPSIQRYRNKAQFPVAPGPAIGFYRRGTHQVQDVADCLLQSKAAARLRAAVKDWMIRFQVPAYQERTGAGLVRHVYVRTSRAGQALCCLLVNGEALPHEDELVQALRRAEPGLAGIVLGVNTSRSNVILGERYRILWGADCLEDTLCGLRFSLSVPSFYQVNPEQTEVLYALAAQYAGLTGGETLLDLYCGIGTIGLSMAARAGRVIGVEVVEQAVRDARDNAERSGIANAEFFCADAGAAARELARRGLRPDVVCVDPPRKGLAEDVPGTIASMAPIRVVYVSCDPATLARDLGRFAQLGYQALRAEAVDMFPRTAHVETVVLLSRLKSAQHMEVEVEMDELDLTARSAAPPGGPTARPS